VSKSKVPTKRSPKKKNEKMKDSLWRIASISSTNDQSMTALNKGCCNARKLGINFNLWV